MRKKRKKGSTDLLNQYEDFCTKCRHKSKSVCKKGHGEVFYYLREPSKKSR